MAERFREDIITDDFVERILEKYFGNRNFKLVEFTATPGTTKGDNYMGDLVTTQRFYKTGVNVSRFLSEISSLTKSTRINQF